MKNSKANLSQRILVMGVSGSGKSTIGQAIADALNCEFIDGDSLHPEQNITKMKQGLALNDQDRKPWLDAVARHISCARSQNASLVIVCSALKKDYRAVLRDADANLITVFLALDESTLMKRMQNRQHFMPASLLQSQLNTLEDPSDEVNVIAIKNDKRFSSIIEEVLTKLNG